ncbi:MAG TPA: fused MFS/spermidine synthase [Candidatus Acidoferrum sp.]|nr:fused MFS/spermidine synthase [Candidatus Acidoferrum sp.]
MLLSGFAALSWEVIWQIKSTLALGVSAWGAALTLAVTMGGMSLGGFAMGRVLREGLAVRAAVLYGALECAIGVAGLFLNSAFGLVERLDSWAYAASPGSASLVHILGIAAVLGVPTVCMGATLPVFGLLSRQFQLPVAELYGLNTVGAAAGCLVVALVLIPWGGITHSIWLVAGVNTTVAIAAWLLDRAGRTSAEPLPEAGAPPAQTAAGSPAARLAPLKESFVVFVTGFATFTLEIAWFRSFSATFPDRADIFAMMLACVLIALGWAARSVPRLKQRKKSLGVRLCLAGVLILLATAVVEWIDILWLMLGPALNKLGLGLSAGLLDPATFAATGRATVRYVVQAAIMFGVMLCVIAPPVKYLGEAFPWILDDQRSSRRLGMLYALNTLAAILGAIVTAWVLLPTIGFANAACIAGALVVAAGLLIIPGEKRFAWGWAGLLALFMAVATQLSASGPRVQGQFATAEGKPAKVVESFQGPEATASVIEYDDGGRVLLIDASSASGQSGQTYNLGEHYMNWMGHLPMLLHPDPKRALVICFGTGQTANSVRKEGPQALDIVDVNPRVFKLAHNFSANEDVLHDPRVNAIVMDGRAFLRRTTNLYDVITLEPMPPTDAGVNALYSRQFYELARARLGPKGVIAQWLPFHCVSPLSAAAIARTFVAVFPNAVLWMDPETKHDGVLLGTKDDSSPLGSAWPGFARAPIKRDLDQEQVRRCIMLNTAQLKRYSAWGQVVSDDNQLLGYGKALVCQQGLMKENYALLRRANPQVGEPGDLAPTPVRQLAPP